MPRSIDLFLVKLAERLGHSVGPGQTTDKQLKAAEDALGITLPSSYKMLVRSCRFNELPHWIYWVGNQPWPALDLVLANKEKLLPPFLIAVSPELSGDEFCFDTRSPDAAGEFPIVQWKHETQDETSVEFEVIRKDLSLFLLDLV